jgi:hypothetical protein
LIKIKTLIETQARFEKSERACRAENPSKQGITQAETILKLPAQELLE